MKYIIQTRDAFGPCYLRVSGSLVGRFCTKDEATRFDDIGPAKDWLASQKATINAQVFARCKIVEA